MQLSEVDWLTTSQVIECDWCDIELMEESNELLYSNFRVNCNN